MKRRVGALYKTLQFKIKKKISKILHISNKLLIFAWS